jgi:hypothetical protein
LSHNGLNFSDTRLMFVIFVLSFYVIYVVSYKCNNVGIWMFPHWNVYIVQYSILLTVVVICPHVFMFLIFIM